MVIYRMGELFAGAGGLALGAKMARVEAGSEVFGVEHVWANDYDEWACQTYTRNICRDHPERVILEDVRRLDVSKLSPIDGLAFGFPCNDFSVVGEQKGLGGNFGPLYKSGVRVLDEFRPLWFVAENVGGLQSVDDGRTLKIILKDLQNAGPGYKLTAHIYRFEDYGVPQIRHRIIIVGIRSDIGLEYKVPAPTYEGHPRTAREALEDPPIPKNAANQERTKQSPAVVERLQYIGPGENAWSPNVPERLRLKVKGARLSQIYRRLDPDKPSYTITASGGGGTHGYHWSEPRALSNRERARIQTFPDDFVFEGLRRASVGRSAWRFPLLGRR